MGLSYLDRKENCPKCAARTGVPILYGMPSPEMFERLERGEIVAGGCVIEKDAPEWACQACGFRW